jgi:hypothetical protein
VYGRIAQSVERWSNKPLVKGSSPFVTTFFVFVSFGGWFSHTFQPYSLGIPP